MIELSCLASGFILGLLGGLQIGIAFLNNLARRIEELEQGITCGAEARQSPCIPIGAMTGIDNLEKKNEPLIRD